MVTIGVTTRRRMEFIDITSDIVRIVAQTKKEEGVCIVFCPHTTAALTINENADPSVQRDIINHLNTLVPDDGRYKHSEGNADAHIKSSLIGPSLTLIIKGGKLVLGTWQGIYFCEFDGPRERNVHINIT